MAKIYINNDNNSVIIREIVFNSIIWLGLMDHVPYIK